MDTGKRICFRSTSSSNLKKISEISDRWIPKFRFAMSRSTPKGTINPLVFDTVVHNEHIEYHNGIVLIMQPGYYTFTVQGRNGVKGRELALYILIDNRRVALGKR